jgi:hypothetical protein
MTKGIFCFFLMMLLMTVRVKAAEVPRDLLDSLPQAAEDLLSGSDFSAASSFADGIGKILRVLPGQAAEILGNNLRGAVTVLLIAVFCGAVNCPIASMLLGMELFGGEGLLFYAVACAVSYLMSGYSGLYTSQTILYSKKRAQYINVHTKE